MHWWAWLENLTKPFSLLLNPPAERLGKWLGRRTPRLHAHIEPVSSFWCIGHAGDVKDRANQFMQTVFHAELTHDDDKQSLVIMNAYPEGTETKFAAMTQFKIPPKTLISQQISSFVLPIQAQPGETFECRYILVDQFHRNYRTQRIVFSGQDHRLPVSRVHSERPA